MSLRVLNLLAVITLGLPALAFGQTLESAEGVIRIGRLYALPRIALTNVGIDSNVFNEPDNPRSDRTFSVLPDLAYEIRLRNVTLSGLSAMSYHYFDTYERERSTNYAQELRINVPLNRLILKANYTLASTRQRPGLEYDTRSRQNTEGYVAEVDARIRPKTVARVGASSITTRFEDGVESGVFLPVAMNRTSDLAYLSLRQEVTSLTTLLLTGEGIRDRFEFDSVKDATGFRVMPGMEFSKFALISGGFSVGLRRFLPEAPIVPSYSGVVARANLSSVVRRNTRLAGQIDRDVAYSYQKDYPYSLQISATLSATQRLGSHWDAVVSASGQELSYRGFLTPPPSAPIDPDAPPLGPPPITRGRLYSLSLGYLWGKGRVAVEARHNERLTGRAENDYTSKQIGGSFTYGF